jgi:hypothetical protein
MPRIAHLILLVLAATSVSAFAQSDREVVESMVTRSANVCPGHSAERTMPTVKADARRRVARDAGARSGDVS